MATVRSVSAPNILRKITPPVAGFVVVFVAAAWYVTWSTSDVTRSFLMMGTPSDPVGVGLFFGLMIVMMVAMMLPAALPMIVAFHGMTRLEAGRPTKPADLLATTLFVGAYFLVWGTFGVLALAALIVVGLMGPFEGLLALAPAATLLAAGVYQVSRPKEVCLEHCQSPLSFVMHHWRSGRMGAVRMGLRHSMYCLGCCWLFMLVLFIAGSMSLLWMGGLSAVIFAEKVTTKRLTVTRAIGAVLLVLGTILVMRTFIPV